MARDRLGQLEGAAVERVGIRELRQNLSVYLRRVQAGRELEVTDRGRVIARLLPAAEATASILDDWIARGWATPAKGDLATLGLPPEPTTAGRPLSELVGELRDEDPR